MREANKRFEAPVRDFLKGIVEDPERHARFLNMISMLEHRGSRKIMLSQMNRTLTEDTLKHLAEEARHAYFFKRQAERVAGQSLDGYEEHNTMCRIPALLYFSRLDAGISAQVPDAQAYPWVSLIVEFRACWLFGLYQDVLEEAGRPFSLKGLLAEEDGHLDAMFALCGDDTERLQSFCAYETHLFEKFWSQLQSCGSLRQAA